MFGYIKPFKPQMKFCEYDFYKAVYCGLCKEMGKEYGFFFRFTLSYDFAFLALLDFSVNGVQPEITPQVCMAHPLKKTPCAVCRGDFRYTGAAAVISVYHKLKDDVSDKGFFRKIVAACMLPFFKKGYKKAKSLFPTLAETVETQMKNQSALEKEKCKSIDRAAEPTAMIMGEIAGELSYEPEKKALLTRFGYLLGRYVYLADAFDDASGDRKNNSYNPLLLQEENSPKKLQETAKDSIFFTLGELANVYVKLNLEKFRPILDNIVYMGLKNTFFEIIRNNK